MSQRLDVQYYFEVLIHFFPKGKKAKKYLELDGSGTIPINILDEGATQELVRAEIISLVIAHHLGEEQLIQTGHGRVRDYVKIKHFVLVPNKL